MNSSESAEICDSTCGLISRSPVISFCSQHILTNDVIGLRIVETKSYVTYFNAVLYIKLYIIFFSLITYLARRSGEE